MPWCSKIQTRDTRLWCRLLVWNVGKAENFNVYFKWPPRLAHTEKLSPYAQTKKQKIELSVRPEFKKKRKKDWHMHLNVSWCDSVYRTLTSLWNFPLRLHFSTFLGFLASVSKHNSLKMSFWHLQIISFKALFFFFSMFVDLNNQFFTFFIWCFCTELPRNRLLLLHWKWECDVFAWAICRQHLGSSMTFV